MSKAAKISIFILIALLLLTFGLSILILLDKQKTESHVAALQQDISAYQDREKKYILESKDVKQKAQEIEAANAKLAEQLARFEEVDLDDMENKLKQLAQERDKWEKQVKEITAERDRALAQVKETRIQLQEAVKKSQSGAQQPAAASVQPPPSGEQFGGQQEGYWARILKERAELAVKADDLTRQLNQANVKITELKKENSDLQMAVTDLQRVKEEIDRQVKRGQDLADSLSLQLARAQNDKDYLSGRIEKITRENDSLRTQIRELTGTKLALEKSIVRMQEEKKDVEKRLTKTENVIQERIDDIWQLKKSLDDTLEDGAAAKDGIELSPIVVSPGGGENAAVATPPVEGTRRTFDANVVSVNSENNFVIINAGAAAGLKLGDMLNVYRGSDFIAGIEVIQVRNDIAAADIKNRSDTIQVGDVVR